MKKLISVVLCFSIFAFSLFSQSNDDENNFEEELDIETSIDESYNHYYDSHDKHDSKRPVHRHPERKKRPVYKKTHRYNETVTESLAEFFLDVLIELSIENNLRAAFDYYPYATSDHYVQFYQYQPEEFPQRFCRFNVDLTGFYYPNTLTIAPDIKFSGYLFKFFGPLFENTNFINFDSYPYYAGNFKLGMEFAVVQTFIFNFSWSMQWVQFYGNNQDPLNGICFGALIKSYPFKPVVVEYRFKYSNFLDQRSYSSSDVFDSNSILESVLEIGLMLSSPFEIYGSWRYIADGIFQVREHTFGMGLKYYF